MVQGGGQISYAGPVSRDPDESAVADTLAAGAGTAVDDTVTAMSSDPDLRSRADVRERVGRYRLIRQLGAGGMGRVYRGHDPNLNRDVAIKVLHPAEQGSDHASELQRRLLREAQAMARLRHAHLAVVHDVGTEGGDVFIAMELVEGSTLKTWLAESHPWRERLRVVVAAGRGLAAAHSAGVIHRDFKPENVLIGRDGVAKVVDFGLARGVDEVETPRPERAIADRDDVLGTPLTVTGALMGTPAYMAPEQHAGEVVDEAADQFSLAVTVFEALYGRRPFAGSTVAALADEVSSGRIETPGDSEVPSAVLDVVLRGLSVAPTERFPDVAGFLDALEAAAHPRRRWWPLVAAGVAAVGAAAVAMALAGGDRDREPRGSLSPEQIQEVVRANQERVRECYVDALTDDPSIGAGTVVVRFFIAESGRVRRTEVDDSKAPSPDVASCVGARAMTWVFPGPQGGPVEVVYPFNFTQPPPLSIEARGDDTYEVTRATVLALLDMPERLRARMVPSRKDGADFGVKVYAIPEGSTLARLGLRNGDTVVALDQFRLVDSDRPIAHLHDHIRRARELRLRIWREGVERTLTYRIVD